MKPQNPIRQIGEERHARILTAALEVFSKCSFGDATTDEIARRACVSKRDIYAEFPDKHAILAAVVNIVLQTGDENIQRVVSDSCHFIKSRQKRLEIVGLALMSEILSPVTGFLCRLVSSESLKQPPIGALYFENWYTRRNQLIARLFSEGTTGTKRKIRRPYDAQQAARHYVALITQLPQLTASVGMREMWTPKSIETHVRTAVQCFRKAYPNFD
jgi:AcrR family transcriptional regulator